MAIAIPIFTSQLEKSREATDLSNIRSYYAEITTALLTGDLKKNGDTVTVANNLTATLKNDLPTTAGSTFEVELPMSFQQNQKGWQTASYDVAGVSSITDWDSSAKTTYRFTLANDGDYVLSAITLS